MVSERVCLLLLFPRGQAAFSGLHVPFINSPHFINKDREDSVFPQVMHQAIVKPEFEPRHSGPRIRIGIQTLFETDWGP